MRDAARIRCVGDVLYSVVTRGEGVCRRRRPRRAALDSGLSAHGTAERLATQRRMGVLGSVPRPASTRSVSLLVDAVGAMRGWSKAGGRGSSREQVCPCEEVAGSSSLPE